MSEAETEFLPGTEATSLSTSERLKNFLAEANQAYVDNRMHVERRADGCYVATYRSGEFRISDEWHQSEDERIYGGMEVVTLQSVPIWLCGYYAKVADATVPETVLEIYHQALRQSDPEFPVRGPGELEVGEYKYVLDSLSGPRDIGRFAITEHISQNGRRVYNGHLAGGYLVPKEVAVAT